MQRQHRPLDGSERDPLAPGYVTEAIAGVLGDRREDVRTHPWHVTRRIHLSPTLAVRDSPDSPMARDAAARELCVARGIGSPLVQQPAWDAPIVTSGRVLTLWHKVHGTVGQNRRHEALQAAGMLAALHAVDVPAGVSSATDPLEAVRGLLGAARAHREHAERHWNAARDILDEAGPATDTCLIHGDAHGGNIIFSHGSGTFIDLENSGGGDPHWDIAVLWRASRKALGERSLEQIVERYGSKLDLRRVRHLAYVRGAATLPVKLTSAGLAHLDFTDDVRALENELAALD